MRKPTLILVSCDTEFFCENVEFCTSAARVHVALSQHVHIVGLCDQAHRAVIFAIAELFF